MEIKLHKGLEIVKGEKDIELPKDIVEKIEIFWQKQVEENPYLFNGEVWSVTKFEELEDRLRLTVQKTNYAHYLYDERIGLEGNLGCYNLNGGILLETLDKKYIVGEMAETTSYPKGLQIPGGNLDQNDIKEDGTVDLIGNIARELQEELNLDLFDKSIIQSYKMQYMELPEGKRHAYSPKLKGFLEMTSKEMKDYYEKYKTYLKETNKEVEFAKLYFIDKENAVAELDALDNPKRPYLRNLLGMDSIRGMKITISKMDLRKQFEI